MSPSVLINGIAVPFYLLHAARYGKTVGVKLVRSWEALNFNARVQSFETLKDDRGRYGLKVALRDAETDAPYEVVLDCNSFTKLGMTHCKTDISYNEEMVDNFLFKKSWSSKELGVHRCGEE